MRIRRRDKQPPPKPATTQPPPSDPQGPTSMDPVRSLITEAQPAAQAPSPPASDPKPNSSPLAGRESAPVPATPASPTSAAPAGLVRESRPPQPAPSPKSQAVAQQGDQTPAEPEAKPTEQQKTGAEAQSDAPAEAMAEPVAEAVAEPDVLPAEMPAEEPEAEMAKKPKPDKRPKKADPDQPAMRPPTIGDEANELLNGSKPTARELPRVIAIANQKGGVGKTTTTVNLGAALAEQGYRVLVVDLDPQGNATTGLGLESRNFELSMYDVIMREQPLEDCIEPTSVKNLFVAPATIDLAGVEIELVPAFSRELKLKRAVETIVDDFDFVLIDCPPSLGLITVNGLAAADEVLVPIQCEYYALEGLSQLLRNVNLVSTNLNATLEVTTIVLTMYDSRTRLSVDVANEVREHFSERVCRVMIPRTVRLSEAPSFGQPITVFDPSSRGAVAYRELAKEVSNGAPQRTR